MSKIRLSKKSLLTKILVTIVKIYRHKLNVKIFFVIVIFLYFFAENDLGVFSVAYNKENGNRNYSKKLKNIYMRSL